MEDRIARALQRTQEIEQLLQGLTLELQEIQQEISQPDNVVPVAAAVPAPALAASNPEDVPRIQVCLSERLSDGSCPPKHIRVGDKVKFFRTSVTCAGTGIIDGVNKRGWLIINRVAPKGPCLIDPVTRAPWKVLKLED